MSDVIDREKAIVAVQEAVLNGESWYDALANLPSALTGYWKVINDPAEWGTWNAECSNCGEKRFFPEVFVGKYYRVCPKCGSIMER